MTVPMAVLSTSETAAPKKASGSLNVYLNVSGPVISRLVISRAIRTVDTPAASSVMDQFAIKATSLTSSSSPLWNCMPGRMVNSHARPSSTISHLLAIPVAGSSTKLPSCKLPPTSQTCAIRCHRLFSPAAYFELNSSLPWVVTITVNFSMSPDSICIAGASVGEGTAVAAAPPAICGAVVAGAVFSALGAAGSPAPPQAVPTSSSNAAAAASRGNGNIRAANFVVIPTSSND